MSQGDKSAYMSVESGYNYMTTMTEALHHQVFVVSSWAGDDSWLRLSDVPCSGTPADSKHTVSNITITSVTPEMEEVLVCDPEHPKTCVGDFTQ